MGPWSIFVSFALLWAWQRNRKRERERGETRRRKLTAKVLQISTKFVTEPGKVASCCLHVYKVFAYGTGDEMVMFSINV